jgi:hypothetical protein
METSVKVSKLITQIPSLQKEVTIRTLSKVIVLGTVIKMFQRHNSFRQFHGSFPSENEYQEHSWG